MADWHLLQFLTEGGAEELVTLTCSANDNSGLEESYRDVESVGAVRLRPVKKNSYCVLVLSGKAMFIGENYE